MATTSGNTSAFSLAEVLNDVIKGRGIGRLDAEHGLSALYGLMVAFVMLP